MLSMAVVPEARSRGFGRLLMEQLEARAGELRCQEVQLEVRIGNQVARSLYRSCGYAEVGSRKGYYGDTGEDAVLMSKGLDTGPAEE